MNTCTRRIDQLNSEAWTLTLSSPEGARALAETALAAAEEAGYGRGMAEARFNLGWCAYYLTRLGPAMESFQGALSGFTALGDALGVMKSLNALGVTYMDMGRYERAMDFYTRSLEEARRRGNRLREAVTLDSIGEVCLEFGEIKEAFDYFLRAYETVPDDGEGEGEIIASILLDVGKAYQNMGNWSLARDFAEKAMAVAQKDGNLQVEGQCWHLLGLISLANGRLELAASHYVKALGFSETLKNERERASVLLDLGPSTSWPATWTGPSSASGSPSRARRASAPNASSTGPTSGCPRPTRAMGDFRSALDYYKRFSRFKHESLSEDAGRKIKNIAVQYEVEKSSQEAEIYRLKNIELKGKTEELESANRQILAIAETGRLITASLDLDTIMNTLYETLSRYIPFDVFGLALYEEDEKALDYRAYILPDEHIQRSQTSPDPERSYAAICLRDKAPVFVPDTEADPPVPSRRKAPRRPFSARPAGSLMFLPLVIDDRAIGLLTVQSEKQEAITLATSPWWKPWHPTSPSPSRTASSTTGSRPTITPFGARRRSLRGRRSASRTSPTTIP